MLWLRAKLLVRIERFSTSMTKSVIGVTKLVKDDSFFLDI